MFESLPKEGQKRTYAVVMMCEDVPMSKVIQCQLRSLKVIKPCQDDIKPLMSQRVKAWMIYLLAQYKDPIEIVEVKRSFNVNLGH